MDTSEPSGNVVVQHASVADARRAWEERINPGMMNQIQNPPGATSAIPCRSPAPRRPPDKTASLGWWRCAKISWAFARHRPCGDIRLLFVRIALLWLDPVGLAYWPRCRPEPLAGFRQRLGVWLVERAGKWQGVDVHGPREIVWRELVQTMHERLRQGTYQRWPGSR